MRSVTAADYMNTGRRIIVLDTTLRDGDQAPGFAFSFSEKIRIASMLERLGVDIIEAGFPASSKADFESVRAISSMVENTIVSAMARSVVSDIESAARAIENAGRKMIHLTIATSAIHREYKLSLSRSQVIKKAVDAVYCAKKHADIVEIGAEDAVRTEHEFLMEFCIAVTEAGADTVNISDTVGYSMPSEFAHLVRFLKTNVPAFAKNLSALSVHCHNDLGLAAANTLAGIEAGASQIETTLLGIGERAGNTAIEEILAAFESRSDYFGGAYTGINNSAISESLRTFSRIIGIPPAPNKPVVGCNAFAHASGIHQDGMLSNPRTYSLFPPESFGFTGYRFVMTRHSGSRGLSHAIFKSCGKKIEGKALLPIYEKFKEKDEWNRSVPFTEFAFFLKDEKLVSSELWRVNKCGYIPGDDATQKYLIEVISDNGKKIDIEFASAPEITDLHNKFNKIFNLNVSIKEVAFTYDGNSSESNGRFHVHVLVSGESFYFERFGKDISVLASETFIDIVNTMNCLQPGLDV